MLKNAWFIATRDVAYMLRQKETVLWVFVMPFVFFYFIGAVTGSLSRAARGMFSLPSRPLSPTSK